MSPNKPRVLGQACPARNDRRKWRSEAKCCPFHPSNFSYKSLYWIFDNVSC